MGVIQTSKDQALVVTDSTKVKYKGISKGKKPKEDDSNPKENQKTSEEASSSNKKKKCPYCMKKTLDQKTRASRRPSTN